LGLAAIPDWCGFDLGQLQLLLHLLRRWQWLRAVTENHQVCASMYPKRENSQPFSQLFFTKVYYPLWGDWCGAAMLFVSGQFVAGDGFSDKDAGNKRP
jgi:hypothetical protein